MVLEQCFTVSHIFIIIAMTKEVAWLKVKHLQLSLFFQWEALIALHGQITGQQLQLMAVRPHSLSIPF
uniref:Uncharacterized protein n=1 Tax=Medicago truncatula TaxID=3880 RepID=I3SMI7_MEDTR|nr:unknown [Medicago truncatula]